MELVRARGEEIVVSMTEEEIMAIDRAMRRYGELVKHTDRAHNDVCDGLLDICNTLF